MSARKRGLGRGLDALLGGVNINQEVPGEDNIPTLQVRVDNDLKHLPIEFIRPGKYQPRLDMQPETLQELADSIKAQGVIQPIVVRSIAENQYEIIAGERRWRATQLAGIDTIPVIVKDVPDDAAIAMALIENIQREDLNPIEEAMALKRLQDEFELTQQEVADAVGKSRATVTNLMRLMSLNVDVRRSLEHGDLEMGHARALLSLDSEKQTAASKSVIGGGLSVRQTESLVRRLQAESSGEKASSEVDPDIKKLQDDLSATLGTKVTIQHSAKGKGKLILKYSSLDQLDGILAHIK